MFKKKIFHWAALSAMFTLAINLQSRQANAIVGLATANPGLAMAGGITMGAAAISPIALGGLGCGVGAVIGAVNDRTLQGCTAGMTAGLITSSALGSTAFVIGLVLLPSGETQKVAYLPISQTEAAILKAKVEMTDEEALAYNDENEEINAVAEMIASNMMAANDFSTSFGKAQWLKARPALSEAAFSAVTKVSALPYLESEKK